MRASSGTTAALLALAWLGCGTPPAPGPPLEAAPPPLPPEEFSGERAWRHLEALAAIGPRAAGSEGAARAREYLRAELAASGLEVGEQRTRIEREPGSPVLETVNLFAAIPGESTDGILLVAPYDTRPAVRGVGANDGASGAALVLELGRALQERRPRYTIWLAFVEGDALVRGGGSGAREPVRIGTGALVASFGDEGRMERVRLAVYFNRVADPDLRIARDLLSNRSLREEFWAAARRLGRTGAFPPDAAFESVDAGHRAFPAAGMRSAIAIVGTRSEPGDAADAPVDDLAHSSAESLAVAGTVSLDALVAIASRLARIDRFVESPITARPGPEPAPADPDASRAEP